MLAASVSSLSVLVLLGPASDAFEGLSILPRIVVLTAVLFFLPSLLLGLVIPVVIKLRLKDLSHAGNVVGQT